MMILLVVNVVVEFVFVIFIVMFCVVLIIGILLVRVVIFVFCEYREVVVFCLIFR